ncbi:uncharacterized protein [Vulpes vulpes]|uniref:Uncharacterized protein n=1 Tax=Vulpes vulpes TaxID=9627 RepID=A0ABM4XTT5_VULVU
MQDRQAPPSHYSNSRLPFKPANVSEAPLRRIPPPSRPARSFGLISHQADCSSALKRLTSRRETCQAGGSTSQDREQAAADERLGDPSGIHCSLAWLGPAPSPDSQWNELPASCFSLRLRLLLEACLAGTRRRDHRDVGSSKFTRENFREGISWWDSVMTYFRRSHIFFSATGRTSRETGAVTGILTNPVGSAGFRGSGLGACPLVSRPHDDCVACLDSGTDTNSSVDTEVLETFQMSLLRDTLSIENTTSRSLQAPLARAVETSALPLGLLTFPQDGNKRDQMMTAVSSIAKPQYHQLPNRPSSISWSKEESCVSPATGSTKQEEQESWLKRTRSS